MRVDVLNNGDVTYNGELIGYLVVNSDADATHQFFNLYGALIYKSNSLYAIKKRIKHELREQGND